MLYKTPCILHENTIFPFGQPTLRRYFENLVGDWLEHESSRCLQDYDNLISEYVGLGLLRCKADYLNEGGIKKLTNTKKRICDFLIEEKDCYILVEVKNKSLTKKTPTSSNAVPIKSKLKATILSAIEQLNDTMDMFSDLPKFKNRKCYKVIVINSDLWLGGY